MKPKGGFTLNLEFLLDLLLGILLGLVLLYLITLIYGIFFSGKEKAEAIQTLNSIEENVKSLGLEQTAKLPLVVPTGQYLLSFEWGVNSEKKEILPQTFCADANCLCVCKSVKRFGFIETSIDCRKNAECRVFSRPFKENGKDLYIKIPQKNLIEITNYKTGDYGFFNVAKK